MLGVGLGRTTSPGPDIFPTGCQTPRGLWGQPGHTRVPRLSPGDEPSPARRRHPALPAPLRAAMAPAPLRCGDRGQSVPSPCHLCSRDPKGWGTPGPAPEAAGPCLPWRGRGTRCSLNTLPDAPSCSGAARAAAGHRESAQGWGHRRGGGRVGNTPRVDAQGCWSAERPAASSPLGNKPPAASQLGFAQGREEATLEPGGTFSPRGQVRPPGAHRAHGQLAGARQRHRSPPPGPSGARSHGSVPAADAGARQVCAKTKL